MTSPGGAASGERLRVGIIGERRNPMPFAMLAASVACPAVEVVWFADATLSPGAHERRYGRPFVPGLGMRAALFLQSLLHGQFWRRRQDCLQLCRRLGVTFLTPADHSINRGLPPRMYAEPDVDYVLIAGCDQILDSNALGLARRKVINYHYSLLPAYRGKNAIFWQWYNREPSIGYTFHEVESDVDTGRAILQGTVAYDPHENLTAIAERAVSAAAARLPELYRCLATGSTNVLDPRGDPGYYSIRDHRELETMTRERTVRDVLATFERLGGMRLANGLHVTRVVRSGSLQKDRHELRPDGIVVPLADGHVVVAFRSRVPFRIAALLIGRANLLRGLD